MFFYFIHCSLGTQPGSAVGKKGIRRETAKKSASEAHRAVDWGGKRAAELRQPPPFPLPKLPLAIFFFFWLFPLASEPGPGLHSRPGKEAHHQPSHGEKLSRENRVSPSRVNSECLCAKNAGPFTQAKS